MGPIGFPETSVRNYHYSLRNNPKERSTHIEGILKHSTAADCHLHTIRTQNRLFWLINYSKPSTCFNSKYENIIKGTRHNVILQFYSGPNTFRFRVLNKLHFCTS
jgi:hypothetical protein